MRSFLAAALALVSLVLTAVAVPCIWTEKNIVSESGFVAMASPLGSDAEFQSALATAVSETVTSQLKIDDRLRTLVQPVIESATKSLTTDPGYPQAWTEILRRSHAVDFIDPGQTAGSDDLKLDIAPLLQLLAAKVPAGLDSAVSVPAQVLISLGHPEQRAALSKFAAFASVGYWLAGAAALVFLIALAAARRKSTTLLLVGLGLAVTCGVWKLGIDGAGQQLRAGASADPVAKLFIQQLANASTASFGVWIIYGLVAAGVLVVGGGLGKAFARS